MSNMENTARDGRTAAADADYRRRDRNRRRHHHRVHYLRHKFVINEVAWLSGRGRRGARKGFKRDADAQ